MTSQEERAKIKQAEKLLNTPQLTREQINCVLARNISDEEWIIYISATTLAQSSHRSDICNLLGNMNEATEREGVVKTITEKEYVKITQAEKLYNKKSITREQMNKAILRKISDAEWMAYLATSTLQQSTHWSSINNIISNMIKTARGTQEESAKIKQAEKLYNKLQITREQIKEVIARNISDEEWIIYLATNSICPPSLNN